MRIFLLLSLSSSLVAMNVELASVAKKVNQKLNYGTVCGMLKEAGLLAMRELVTSEDLANQRKVYKLIELLRKNECITENDEVFLSECLKGRMGEFKHEPHLVLVRDLGVYCAVLCSHDEIACKLYRASNNAEARIEGFLKRLFCLAIVKDCPELAQRILKGLAEHFKDQVLMT